MQYKQPSPDKQCKTCKEHKSKNLFRIDKAYSDGLRQNCLICEAEYQKRYHKDYRAKRIASGNPFRKYDNLTKYTPMHLVSPDLLDDVRVKKRQAKEKYLERYPEKKAAGVAINKGNYILIHLKELIISSNYLFSKSKWINLEA